MQRNCLHSWGVILSCHENQEGWKKFDVTCIGKWEKFTALGEQLQIIMSRSPTYVVRGVNMSHDVAQVSVLSP